ncbi:hypothetical protein F6Y05_38165 [Bacillus megaterium]|nr:hypothetical protein [Priestia megaterium]
MTGFLGFVYRFILFIFATFNGIVTLGHLHKATIGGSKEHFIPFAVGALFSIVFYYMFYRSRKRVKQFKQRHNIASEGTAPVKEDVDDDVSYSRTQQSKEF